MPVTFFFRINLQKIKMRQIENNLIRTDHMKKRNMLSS